MENKQLYGHLPPVSTKVMSRRIRMVGHYVRYPELSTNPLILWEPIHGSAYHGRFRLTYVYMLRKAIGLYTEKQEIRTCMMDRDVWRKLCYTNARDEDRQDRPRNYIYIYIYIYIYMLDS